MVSVNLNSNKHEKTTVERPWRSHQNLEAPFLVLEQQRLVSLQARDLHRLCRILKVIYSVLVCKPKKKKKATRCSHIHRSLPSKTERWFRTRIH